MTQAQRIIERFGSMSALGRAFNPPRSPSTVQRWKESGFIPSRYHDEILAAARREGVALELSDFFGNAA